MNLGLGLKSSASTRCCACTTLVGTGSTPCTCRLKRVARRTTSRPRPQPTSTATPARGRSALASMSSSKSVRGVAGTQAEICGEFLLDAAKRLANCVGIPEPVDCSIGGEELFDALDRFDRGCGMVTPHDGQPHEPRRRATVEQVNVGATLGKRRCPRAVKHWPLRLPRDLRWHCRSIRRRAASDPLAGQRPDPSMHDAQTRSRTAIEWPAHSPLAELARYHRTTGRLADGRTVIRAQPRAPRPLNTPRLTAAMQAGGTGGDDPPLRRHGPRSRLPAAQSSSTARGAG